MWISSSMIVCMIIMLIIIVFIIIVFIIIVFISLVSIIWTPFFSKVFRYPSRNSSNHSPFVMIASAVSIAFTSLGLGCQV